eukprot:gene13231-9478_t
MRPTQRRRHDDRSRFSVEASRDLCTARPNGPTKWHRCTRRRCLRLLRESPRRRSSGPTVEGNGPPPTATTTTTVTAPATARRHPPQCHRSSDGARPVTRIFAGAFSAKNDAPDREAAQRRVTQRQRRVLQRRRRTAQAPPPSAVDKGVSAERTAPRRSARRSATAREIATGHHATAPAAWPPLRRPPRH